MADTYTTEWKSPTETGGQWRAVISKGTATAAQTALDKLVQQRRHCRLVVHREGQEDYTVDERGPFHGGRRAGDR